MGLTGGFNREEEDRICRMLLNRLREEDRIRRILLNRLREEKLKVSVVLCSVHTVPRIGKGSELRHIPSDLLRMLVKML